jgi:hypothetical protein
LSVTFVFIAALEVVGEWYNAEENAWSAPFHSTLNIEHSPFNIEPLESRRT